MYSPGKFWYLLIWLALTVGGVLVAHLVFAIGWGIPVIVGTILFAAVLINGLLAAMEDGQPGGFSGPEPKQSEKISENE
ncbi:MAG TPA: hypothetical protein VMJ12_16955 [Candidatus Acidoferrales bacterium]|nr:hypothetical protein [Candidatus Acidoferrales bacterium]